jgi:hypothetical protein
MGILHDNPRSRSARADDPRRTAESPEKVERGLRSHEEPGLRSKSTPAAGQSMVDRHSEERRGLHKSHETERRDMHGNHREEMRKMHERHNRAFSDLGSRHVEETKAIMTRLTAPKPLGRRPRLAQ